MFFWASITTQWKDNNIFYLRISDKYFDKKSYIIKSQLKSVDRKRFIEKILELSNKDFYNIKKNLKNLYSKSSVISPLLIKEVGEVQQRNKSLRLFVKIL